MTDGPSKFDRLPKALTGVRNFNAPKGTLVILIGALLYFAHTAFIPVALAFLFALILSSPVEKLHGFGVARELCATLIVLAEHKAPVYAKSGLTLITSKMRRPPPEILDPRIHHANLLNSILAKIEANNAGADDALMLDLNGKVAETNATHVFIVRKGELATPRAVACPEGITRATVLEICAAEKIPCAEADLTLEEVYRADEVFCAGTMGELAAVTKIDMRIIGDGKVGAMTKRLSELYLRRTATEGSEVCP